MLFVAASKTFDDYRGHIVIRELDGVPVRLLDVDEMLMSKQTDRPEDIPDRQRLLRLKGPRRGSRLATVYPSNATSAARRNG